MKLKTLAETLKWEDVRQALLELNLATLANIEGYERTFNELKRKPADQTQIRIAIKKVTSPDKNKTDFFRVVGLDGTTRLADWHTHKFGPEPTGSEAAEEIPWSIEYTPWSTWLGMEIDNSAFNHSEPEIMARCLHEMTWTGFVEGE